MPINYATIFSPVIDQALIATLTSAPMQADAADIKYEGGSTIKLATVSTSGLGDYNRATGYPSGAVSVDWETYAFDKDRAIRLNIDKFDVDETAFVDTVANAVKVLREENTDPEIDAYRYAKVFSSVAGASLLATPAPMASYVPAIGDILTKLQDDMTAVQDTVGETSPLVCYMSRQAYGVLSKSSEMDKILQVLETNINGVATKVKGLDSMPIIPVPSSRMRTAYTFNDGTSTFGFAAATTAGKINWIIAPRGALKGVVKGDEVKVIEPAVNQSFSGWSIMFRLYHTLIVLSAKIPSMRISFQPGTSALNVTVAKGTSAGTKATATAGTGNKLGYKLSAASIGGTALKDVHISTLALDDEDYTSGADIAATAGQYLTVVQYNATSGLVVASYEKVLAAGDIQ
ncbi:MAG: hypothetical protein WC343_05740 [Bacilli bacterium]|jgi:hypothetical protein